MTVPGTFKKPSILREIEALRVKPDEVVLLRFTEAFSLKEVQLFAAGIEQGPLNGRVICIHVPAAVEAFVVEAPAGPGSGAMLSDPLEEEDL